uniref:Ribosomal protein L32 n=1 Tax=Nitzschia sp. IriIs04 TaxID=1444690 RepID=A0A0S3QPR5_9STRA|nr:ribosomal protein L32 [Nitzschia sp. IriIs04]BAT70319.1 ribosomal protein L32 [Nitzschia sp. IriIs04]
MAVPKKRVSKSKKRIHRKNWYKKSYKKIFKAISLSKSNIKNKIKLTLQIKKVGFSSCL